VNRLLVVEDDESTEAFLAENLEADGFAVTCASGAGEALRALERSQAELVILDVMLAEGSGLEVLDRVRAADGTSTRIDRETPVLVLSGRAAEVDRLRGFARGADDYLVKPFSYPELMARVQALLRRAEGRPKRGTLRVGELVLDPATRHVRLGERSVDLSAKEFALLQALAGEPTRVLSKGELLRDVWGYQAAGVSRTVDTHACRLRRKLGPGYVLSVRGVGYRLVRGGPGTAPC
jgi:DNA-binding response OmpR family regulator